MKESINSPSLNLLRNQIDFTRVPFSDRGSRVLVFLQPDQHQLYIRLAERLTGIEPDIEAYLQRPPFIRDMCLIDENGEKLEYEVETFPHILYFKTRLGDFGLTFYGKHTLTLGPPPNVSAGVRFHVSPQFWKSTPDGGEFKSIRDLSYVTNGEILTNEIIPEQGGYVVKFIISSRDDNTIAFNIGRIPTGPPDVKPFSVICDQGEQHWQDWFSKVPPVAERYRRAYTYAWWIMANNLVQPQGTIIYEAMMPSKVNYVGLWLWDSAMHALAYRHVDPELARNQIRAMLACQLPDGMIPDAVYDEGVIAEIDHPVKAKVTKPPILAWAALKLHETDPDLKFLEEIYVPLVRWNAWWFSMNDDDVDGLAQYNHPYSSGLDDSPLWDYGMPVESPDLNTYLCVQMGSLALMAELLNMHAEAKMWRRRSAAIVQRMIDHFWDPGAGIFRATLNHNPIQVITPFNLYPLWTGQLPGEINDRLLAHITDPAEFWDGYALPTVARNDPHYESDTMWRGPVWVNINYFFIEALHQIGQHDLANKLTDKTLALIMDQPSIYEYYNSDTGKPPEKAAEAFGWTAAVFIDLAIQASKGPKPEQPGE
jgi:putative isomerase